MRIALKNGDPREAIKILTEATGLLDTWMGHFDLGRAYLERGGVSASRLRVRPLRRTPWRGRVVVFGRGADLRLFPTRLLLSGSCSGRAEQRELYRLVSQIHRYPRGCRRRPTSVGSARARGAIAFQLWACLLSGHVAQSRSLLHYFNTIVPPSKVCPVFRLVTSTR